MNDRDSTFSRSDLNRLARLDSEQSDYLLRTGALRPASGGGGKGQHRKFDSFQITIARILSELSRLGIATAALASFAARFSDAADFVRGSDLALAPEAAASLALHYFELDENGNTTIPEQKHFARHFGFDPPRARRRGYLKVTWDEAVSVYRQDYAPRIELDDEFVRQCTRLTRAEFQHLLRFNALDPRPAKVSRKPYLIINRDDEGQWIDQFDDSIPDLGGQAMIVVPIGRLKSELWGCP